MHTNDIPNLDAEPTPEEIAELDASGILTALDAEFHHLISHPTLSAEFAQLREQQPVKTTALLDGTARARRDRRIAQRALGNAVRVLNAHTDLTAPTATGKAAA